MLYILNGHEPVREENVAIWAAFFQDIDRRRVAFSKIDSVDEIVVSTVFLASDHNFGGEGPPILFETLVDGGDTDGEIRRCSTWEQAEQQHKDVVKEIEFTH